MIDFSNYIEDTRRRPSGKSKEENRNICEESVSDRGRVLFSAPFRRLQQKAQVFSLENNAAVRSRLTHSFEVAHIGRQLVQSIISEMRSDESKYNYTLEGAGLDSRALQDAFVNFVETACLVHDIGNPPFGHFGETAIQRWFREHAEECFRNACSGKGSLNDFDEYQDFLEFEGNAQAFRILSSLQWRTDRYSYNLTKTQLHACLKYTRAPYESEDNKKCRKKPGYFKSEEKIVEGIWDEFTDGEPHKSPLAYVMEAADDIAYCLSDIEDAIEKDIVDESVFEKWAQDVENDLIRDAFEHARDKRSEKKDDSFGVSPLNNITAGYVFFRFKIKLSESLRRRAVKSFFDNVDRLKTGKCDAIMSMDGEAEEALDKIKSFSGDNVYSHRKAEYPELAGNTVVFGLFEHLKPLLEMPKNKFTWLMDDDDKDNHEKGPTALQERLFNLIPEKHQMLYEHKVESDEVGGTVDEWFVRAHLIVDFVAGMTDDFAMDLYRTLSGIEVTVEK